MKPARGRALIVISALAVAGVFAVSLVFRSTPEPKEAPEQTPRPPDSTAAPPAAPRQTDAAYDADRLDEDILELLPGDPTSFVSPKRRPTTSCTLSKGAPISRSPH